jgi:hypothetical protein
MTYPPKKKSAKGLSPLGTPLKKKSKRDKRFKGKRAKHKGN